VAQRRGILPDSAHLRITSGEGECGITQPPRARAAAVVTPERVSTMSTLDLTDADKAALVELLSVTIAANRSLASPRIRKLRAILDKLEPPSPRPQP
jgi:hypothetical protein